MGSALSTRAATAARAARPRATAAAPAIPKPAQPATTATTATPATPASPASPGTAPDAPDLPPGFSTQRQTPQEWASTLRAISGSIQSTAWDGDTAHTAGEHGPHPSQRSTALQERLPAARGSSRALQRSAPDAPDAPAGRGAAAPPGRLSQRDVLNLFAARRNSPAINDAHRVAKDFGLSATDVRDLLRHTRTYLASDDMDGTLRGYYNPHVRPPISRFERE